MNERGLEARFSAPGEEKGTSLMGTLGLLRRRWVILAAACALCTLISVALSLTSSTRYLSEATIEVAPERPSDAHDPVAGSPAGGSHLWENHFRTQESLLRRTGLLAGVLDSLTPDKVAVYRNSREPVRELSEDLEINAVPNTFLIKIALEHDRPDNGPEIINKLVALFLEDSNRRLRDLKVSLTSEMDTHSLPVIRQKLSEAERALRTFDQEKGFGVTKERYEALLEASRKISDRRLDVRMRAIGIKSRPDPRTRDLTGPTPTEEGTADDRAARPSALEAQRTTLEIELARQRALLKDKHPTILALQSQLAATEALIRSADEAALKKRERDLTSADLEERALDDEEARLNARIAKTHEIVSQREKLDAEVTASRELLNSYLKKHGELEATSASVLPSVRVVDLVGEARPIPPNHAFNLMVGLIAGLALGTIAILAAEQMDDRINSPQHAEAALGLDVLGSIPRLRAEAGDGNLPCVPAGDGEFEALEPFRRLRTEIAARLEAAPRARCLAVVSAKYGEGKSTVAINLARALALEGRRVVLVDSDLRRPGLKAFLTNKRAPGLEEHLKGAPLMSCIQRSRIPDVHILAPTGPVAGAAELAVSAPFRTLWSELKARFEFVVIDTNPVDAASEAAVIAAGADASILVVEEGRTKIREAARARRRLESHHVRLMGLVVNRSRFDLGHRLESTRAFLNLDKVSGERNAFLELS